MQYIFDTNFYRNLATNNSLEDGKKIINDFKKQKVTRPLFSNIVAIELISHLLDTSPSKQICYNALVLKFFHCSEVKNGRAKGKILPSCKSPVFPTIQN